MPFHVGCSILSMMHDTLVLIEYATSHHYDILQLFRDRDPLRQVTSGSPDNLPIGKREAGGPRQQRGHFTDIFDVFEKIGRRAERV